MRNLRRPISFCVHTRTIVFRVHDYLFVCAHKNLSSDPKRFAGLAELTNGMDCSPGSDGYTSNVSKIIKSIQEAWEPVYNRHKNDPPDYEIFLSLPACAADPYLKIARPGRPRSTPYRPQIDSREIPDQSQMDPRSISDRSLTDRRLNPDRSQIDPGSILLDPGSIPDRFWIDPSRRI